MGETASFHAGIDLDVISLPDLLARDSKAEGGGIRSDPDNHTVFVNGILNRMKGREAFVSFSRQLADVNQILTMAYSSANDIARVILRDLALTSQVLKLVNSSFYRHFSQKGISTISEAMIILGTDEVRGLAASLKLYEMMKDLANTRILKDKTLQGLRRSIMARDLSEAGGDKDSDVLPVSAMIYDMGEYLVALFDPSRYIEIEMVMEDRSLTRSDASKAVLGLSYSDLGRIVATQLNLPEAIVRAIRPVTDFSLNGKVLSGPEETRYLCSFIHELSQIPMDDDDDPFEAAGEVIDKYQDVLSIDLRQAVSLMEMSHEKMVRHAALLNVGPVQNTRAPSRTDGVKDPQGLKDGLSRVRNALNEQMSIHTIFTRIVEIMDRSFHFDQVVICIKKKQTETMEPRFVKGRARPCNMNRALSFKLLDSSQDLFNHALGRRLDMVVRDVNREARKKQVPNWYLERIATPCQVRGFAVFPVYAKGKLLSMIYADWDSHAPEPTQTIIDYVNVFRELMIKTFTMHAK